MKKYKNISVAGIVAILIIIFASSCEKNYEIGNLDDCMISAGSGSIKGDSIFISKGDTLLFNIVGAPDYVVFYTGENGFRYDRKDSTKISGISEMSFDIVTKAKDYKNPVPVTPKYFPLEVYISTDYSGVRVDPGSPLNKVKEQANIDEIAKANWISLTDKFNIPVDGKETQFKTAGTVNLTEYQGQKLYFAFKYKISRAEISRYILIQNFLVVTKTTDMLLGPDGVVEIANIKNAGWYRVFGDVNNQYVWGNPGSAPTRLSYDYREINLKYPEVEEGWMISKGMYLNQGMANKGISVKSFTTSGIATYSYTYNTAGTYKATFVITNGTYVAGMSQKLQEFVVVVK